MAIALTTRGTAFHASNASVSSASFTPAAGALLVVVCEELNQGGTPTLTVSSTFAGQGAWTYYTHQASNGFEIHTCRIAVSVCGASPGSGTLTVTRTGGTSTFGLFAEFFEFTGQASTPIRQNVTNSSTGTSLALNFSGAAASGSYSVFSILTSPNNPTIPSGTVQRGAQNIVSSFYAEHASDSTATQNNSWTGLGSFYANGVGIEIAENTGTSVDAGVANVGAAAQAATGAVKPSGGLASIGAAAQGSTTKVSPTAVVAAVGAAANTASVTLLSGTVNAQAQHAAIGAAANAPGGSVSARSIGTATASATAPQASVSIRVNAGVASIGAAVSTIGVETVEPPVEFVYQASDEDLLELRVAQRAEGYKFLVLDPNLNIIGEVYPEQYARIENTSSQAIKRRMTMRIPADQYDDIDPLRDRIMPVMLLENGSEYPLGVFLFAEATSPEWSFGKMLDATLYDQGLILGQQLRQPLAFNAGDPVVDAMRVVAERGGINTARLDASSATLGSPLAFLAGGNETYASILDQLAKLAGFYSPYFDNRGRLTGRTAIDPNTYTPSLVYGVNGRIIAGSIIRSNNLLSAPNVYVVYDNSATGQPVQAEYPLPDSAPHSFANRGWWLPKVTESPGIGTSEQAYALAQQLAQTEVKAYETVNFQSATDPRHDTFDVLRFDPDDDGGALYIETSWAITCKPGGPMEHEIKRVYVA